MSDLTTADIQLFNDVLPSIKNSLENFFESQITLYQEDLVRAVRLKNRDIQAEAQLAGRIDAYENAMIDLVSYFNK